MTTHPDAADQTARYGVVTRTGTAGYQTWIYAAGFELFADEPAAAGGAEAGPTPYDYLLAGLGACTGMTLRMYASRKGWPLHEAVVRLRQGRSYADDCANCENPDSKLALIEREIELVGPLDAGQRARLMQIAEQCPVHRSLQAGFRLRTYAAANGPTDPAPDPLPGSAGHPAA